MFVGALLIVMLAGFVSELGTFLLGTQLLWVLLACSVVGSLFTVFAAVLHAFSTGLTEIKEAPVPGVDDTALGG
jgi:hypothetical protein